MPGAPILKVNCAEKPASVEKDVVVNRSDLASTGMNPVCVNCAKADRTEAKIHLDVGGVGSQNGVRREHNSIAIVDAKSDLIQVRAVVIGVTVEAFAKALRICNSSGLPVRKGVSKRNPMKGIRV